MIKIYNTEKQEKEVFKPLEEGRVKIYVCGPTTYNLIHLGNARPVVVFDTIRRYFEYAGYEVDYIQNFTDVDDKIINRALEENLAPLELAQRYIDEYFKDTSQLNIKKATHHPKVSENIPQIIEFVEGLIEKGFAYETNGDVYYNVQAFPDYGKLSGRNIDDMLMGARIEVDERKQHPADFALWKAAKDGELAWDSPWGQGRPGWHIECSVMSRRYLGDQFDIHGGGQDLVFPHHENEVAQTEAMTGKKMANYWIHNGFITINKEKMSKSVGNFFLLREILAKFNPMTVRFYLISTHYRSPLDFDDDKLAESQRALERIHNSWQRLKEKAGQAGSGSQTQGENAAGDLDLEKLPPFAAELISKVKGEFVEAMNDDFNTALAMGAIFDYTREVNRLLGDEENADLTEDVYGALLATFTELLDVLGLDMEKVETADGVGDSLLTGQLVELLIDLRQDARKKKDFAAADKIRDGLANLGIKLEDTREGVKWKI